MPGIARAAQKRQEEKVKQAEGRNWQLFLKDGDTALVAIIPSGEDNDYRFESDLYTHSISFLRPDGAPGFRLTICGKTLGENCKQCGPKVWPKHNFAFWVYTYFIVHAKQINEAWEKTTNKLGQVGYKETINDFRVFMQGWGQKDVLFNQIFDIFTENGALNKFLTRIKRTGSGMNDTSYNIVATQNQVELKEEVATKAKGLPNVRDFVIEKFASKEEIVTGVSLDEEIKPKQEMEDEDCLVPETVAAKPVKTTDSWDEVIKERSGKEEVVNPLKGRGRPRKEAKEDKVISNDELTSGSDPIAALIKTGDLF